MPTDHVKESADTAIDGTLIPFPSASKNQKVVLQLQITGFYENPPVVAQRVAFNTVKCLHSFVYKKTT